VGGEKIRPIVKKEIITSDGTTILGADNKDSISAIVEMLTILSEEKRNHRALEIVFTKEEEAISKGAKHLDFSLLGGKKCVISDIAETYGTIVLSAPYCFRFNIKITGRRSHAKEPEKGINATLIAAKAISIMPLGRIDDFTTVNISYQISGLRGLVDDPDKTTASLLKENRNTVPDLAVVLGEVRGAKIDKVKETLSKIQEVLHAESEIAKGIVEFEVEKLADGYYSDQNDALVVEIANLFSAQGVTPRFYHSIGGSDANIFNNRGIHTVVISSPCRNSHKHTEFLLIEDLVKLVDFYLRLVTP